MVIPQLMTLGNVGEAWDVADSEKRRPDERPAEVLRRLRQVGDDDRYVHRDDGGRQAEAHPNRALDERFGGQRDRVGELAAVADLDVVDSESSGRCPKG